jgi:serine protease inhibitor
LPRFSFRYTVNISFLNSGVTVMYKGDPALSQIADANQKLAFSLYCAVAEEPGNLVIAPLPYSLAFALLLNGTDAETQKEIRAFTHLGALELSAVNEQMHALQKALANLSKSSGEAFVLANSLWASLPLSFTKTFLDAGHRYYDTAIESVPREDLPNRVSKWAREKTHDLVDMRLEKTDFALLSATYFKGKWQNPFNESMTRQEDFHPEQGPAHKVPMMTQHGEFSYFQGETFHAVNLEFTFADMCFLLPKDGLLSKRKLAEVEQKVLKDGWIMTQPFAKLPGTVKIPRFKLNKNGDFTPELKRLGVKRLFDSFDSLRPAVTHPAGAAAAAVLQNSTISVDEKGAEAASVLAIPMSVGAAAGWKPPKPFEFIADRPFSFWITEKATGSILFMGRVADPI